MPSFDFFQYTIPEWRTLPPISSDFSLIRGNRGVIETVSSVYPSYPRFPVPVGQHATVIAQLHDTLGRSREYFRERGIDGLGVSRLFKASFPRILSPTGRPFSSRFFLLLPLCIYVSACIFFFQVCHIFFFSPRLLPVIIWMIHDRSHRP